LNAHSLSSLVNFRRAYTKKGKQRVINTRFVPFDSYVETVGKVSSTCLVNFDRCRYSAPCEPAGQIVSIRVYPERIDRVAREAIVGSHARRFGRGEARYDGQHDLPLIERKPGAKRFGAPFMDLPTPLQRLRGLLLKREGGDRIIATDALGGDRLDPARIAGGRSASL
jgi:hypothetical protein